MSTIVVETAEMMNILPTEDQMLINSMVKKLIKAWDPDFTKFTPEEEEEINIITESVKNGEYVSEEDVWN